MNILFVTDLYPVKSGEKNTPLTLHNFVIEWIKQGHSVTVIKPNFILNSFLRKKPFYFTGLYEYDGVKIFNVNYFTPFWFKILNKLPKDIKFADYDVIIGHMPSGVIFAYKLSMIMGKSLVCGVHFSDLKVLTNPDYAFYFREQMKAAYKKSIKIACRSFAIQKIFSEVMPKCSKKTFVAPSGIKLKENLSQASKTYHAINSPFTGTFALQRVSNTSASDQREKNSIVTCANLIKRKNIDILINAVNELDGFKLKVIGDGEELNHLKKISSSKIIFLGRLEHEKVLEEMQKSNIFILPSINETFGMVYLEAMASGCITVCTKDDGIDGIIQDFENGFLCEPTVKNIKETILKIKNLKNIELIRHNSVETVKQYSPEICAQNYLINICKN